jgi:hypothetical protein
MPGEASTGMAKRLRAVFPIVHTAYDYYERI